MTKTQVLVQSLPTIFERYSNGESLPKIAKDFDCNPGLVWVALNKNGYKTKEHKTDPNYLKESTSKIIELYKEGISAYKIRKQFSVHDRIILAILKKAGFDTSLKKKERKDKLIDHTQEIIDLYNSGVGTYKISKMFNCADNNIGKLLKKNNIIIRPLNKYDVDINFFKEINTQEKAYIIGFWYADGNVRPHSIKMDLQEEDGYILEKMKEIIGYQGPIHTILSSLKNPKHKNKKSLCIGRGELSKQLVDLGCVYNKSLILKFPTNNKVPDHLLSHFVRGYFDGDGSVSISKGKFFFVGLTSSSVFINKLNEILINKLGIETKIYVCPNPLTSNLRVNKKESAKKFLQWIYQDSTIHLTRKYEKAKTILDL